MKKFIVALIAMIATFYLIGLITYFVLRCLKLREWISIGGALTFAFLPFIFFRNIEHLVLSSYYFIPLLILLCLWIYEDKNFLVLNKSFFSYKKNILAIIFTALIANSGIVYWHFRFGVCDVDLISGFRIKTFGTVFYYDFNPSEIEVLNLEYLSVPVVPAETLFVLYAMMEGWQRRRRYKRELLFKYLTENLHQPQILKRAKNSYNLPEWLNAFIDKLV